MEFRILGPLYADAATGHGPAVIRQPLLQSALAVLLLRANRPCPRAMLVAALWGGEPPSSPEAALRVCISRLRGCLGDCAVRLDSIGPPGGRAPGHRQQRGYMMTVRPGELDVEEFTDLVAQGQAELDTGNAAAAAASLVRALALWGDPPLPDLPRSAVIAADLERLSNLRQTAADALIEAQLAAGHTDQALGQLRGIVAANPGRERPYDQLMRAYHALGMRKEALDVYQAARRAMREQQGAEPGQALAVLHRRILAEEMASESAAHLSTISNTTPMRLGWQAPAPPSDFTGRAAEIAAIIDRLSGDFVPVTVVTGGPGIGKTTAAAAAALQLRQRFCDGQLYAELGGFQHPRDPQDVLTDMLRAMGIPGRSIPPPGPARAAMYRSLLAGRRVLVIADDATTAGQVRPLVPAASGAAVLVTSRGWLSSLAGALTVELGGLSDDEALSLLQRAAGADRVAAEPAAAQAVVAACGGLPLAVRLAATTLAARPGLTLARLARQLGGSRALDVLVAEDTSIRESLASSYRVLVAPARVALSMAADSIPGDIPGWALAELAQGDRTIPERLAAVGLLAPVNARAAVRRYHLHPLARAFVREQTRPTEHDAAARARLRAAWLRMCSQAVARGPAVPFVPKAALAHPGSPPGPEVEAESSVLGPDWLDGERSNLLAAAEQASAADAHADAIALAGSLIARQCLGGRYGEVIDSWRVLADRAAAAGDRRTADRARFYLAVGIAGSNDRAATAATLLADCVPRLEQAGEREPAAFGYCLLSRYASVAQRHAAAIRMARHAVRLQDDGPAARLLQCCARMVLGVTLARMGICDGGEQACRQARRDAQAMAEPVYEAHALRALALVLLLSSDGQQAAVACEEGLALARDYGSPVDAARCALVLGRVRQRDRDYQSAVASLVPAAAAFTDAGLVVDQVAARSLLAACYRPLGQNKAADAEAELVVQVLAANDIDDANRRATAAERACTLTGDPVLAGRKAGLYGS